MSKVYVSRETALKLDNQITKLVARLDVAVANAFSEKSYQYARALESAVNARANIEVL